jgi:hypothetical protein
MIRKSGVNRVLLSSHWIVSAIVLSAVIFGFDGLIQLKLGIDGAQVTIDGRQSTPTLK